MKIHFLILLAWLLPQGQMSAAGKGNTEATGGILDLREVELDSHRMIPLKGEWIFYWKELVEPGEVQEPGTEMDRDGIAVGVPSYWSGYAVDGQPLPGSGFGTYRLTVLLPDEYRRRLCFDVPVFDVAYRLYLNGELVSSAGEVARTREAEEPWYEPSRLCHQPESDTLEILVHISNFHHRRGGFWRTMVMGGYQKMIHTWERSAIYHYSTVGILFFFTFFYLIFWLYSRKETVMLLFALTTLGILIRSANTGLYLSNAFIDTPWSWQVRMEYFGTYLAYTCGMLFLHRLFFRKYMELPIRINTAVMTLAALSLFLLPVRFFSYEMIVFQPLSVLFLSHYLLISLIGALKKRMTDAVFFASLFFFIFSLVNDILIANTAGATTQYYLTQLSFQLFVFAMAVLVITRWVKNYRDRLNLEASLRFKDQVLSVIAHDLKNPVASMAQFSELLGNKPELIRKTHILNSLQESSRAAVALLDNLLFWSRDQADDLKAEPVPFDAAELAGEVVSLYAHMAGQKEVELELEVAEGSRICADRSLVQIILRNLVSNAIKFTPRNGKVTLSARNEPGQSVLAVSDTGTGIDQDLLDRFREGAVLNSSAEGTEREKGTGLGLKLVRELARKIEGTVQVESESGKGTTFTLRLPRKNGNQPTEIHRKE